MLPTRISVCTASGLLIDDDAPRRSRRLDDGLTRRHVALRPVAERSLGAGERLLGGHVADDREDRVVGPNYFLWNATRSSRVMRGERLRRAGLRQAVGMEAVDQPIEDRLAR